MTEARPGGVTCVYLVDACLEVVATQCAGPEGGLHRMSDRLRARQTVRVAVKLHGLQLGLDGNALVVVEVARVNGGASLVLQVGVGNAPAIELPARIPQDRVEPQQAAQRPLAVGAIACRIVESAKKQGRQRVRLGGLAFFGVAAARVPPEPAAKGVVPQAAAEQEIGLALGRVNVAL